MAVPCRSWVFVVALLCLCRSSFVSAEPGQPNNEQSSFLALPIVGPTCDPSTPVCGEGGINFESACNAINAGVRNFETGIDLQPERSQPDGVCIKEVRQAASCNIRCFRADPVCGEDAVTYWCGAAEAKCAGVEVAYTGYCDLRNGGAGGGTRAAQSLFLVHLIWLVLAGFLIIAGLL